MFAASWLLAHEQAAEKEAAVKDILAIFGLSRDRGLTDWPVEVGLSLELGHENDRLLRAAG
jgi:hypothetical protein